MILVDSSVWIDPRDKRLHVVSGRLALFPVGWHLRLKSATSDPPQ